MNVLQIKKVKNGSYVRSITAYEDPDTAEGKFHEAMSNGIQDSNVVEISCLLLDDVGASYQYSHWVPKTTPTEPEQTPAQNQGE